MVTHTLLIPVGSLRLGCATGCGSRDLPSEGSTQLSLTRKMRKLLELHISTQAATCKLLADRPCHISEMLLSAQPRAHTHIYAQKTEVEGRGADVIKNCLSEKKENGRVGHKSSQQSGSLEVDGHTRFKQYLLRGRRQKSLSSMSAHRAVTDRWSSACNGRGRPEPACRHTLRSKPTH